MGDATLLEQIRNTWLSQAISQSIWGYPIVGALHVLSIALFAGPVLLSTVCRFGGLEPARLALEVRFWKMAGLVAVMLTGVLLFIGQPIGSSRSTFFKIKMAALVLIFLNARRTRRSGWVALGLWAAVIVAARGMAFF